ERPKALTRRTEPCPATCSQAHAVTPRSTLDRLLMVSAWSRDSGASFTATPIRRPPGADPIDKWQSLIKALPRSVASPAEPGNPVETACAARASCGLPEAPRRSCEADWRRVEGRPFGLRSELQRGAPQPHPKV